MRIIPNDNQRNSLHRNATNLHLYTKQRTTETLTTAMPTILHKTLNNNSYFYASSSFLTPLLFLLFLNHRTHGRLTVIRKRFPVVGGSPTKGCRLVSILYKKSFQDKKIICIIEYLRQTYGLLPNSNQQTYRAVMTVCEDQADHYKLTSDL